ncbi:MAG TPA: UTP--glucose-1-phosphate uridylyltransferase [Actinomycetota bacterium]|nr:UTP--glucose-1-phosphate uridylyltransferase [Actinomycetota bacterium]
MAIRKAVIPAAGLGTRMLPASKVVPKVLITLVDRPVIQYAVEELAAAGIDQVCIVISKGQEAVIDHFHPAPAIEEALEARGKQELLRDLQSVSRIANVTSVYQDEPLGLGHAVLCAEDWVGEEPFVVALPDEVYDPATACVKDLIAGFEDSSKSSIAVTRVPMTDISLYGAVEVTGGEPFFRATAVVEKPLQQEAKSDLASVGRYALHPEIFEVLQNLPAGQGGEIQLADALHTLAERDRLGAFRYDGRRWDVGNKRGLLEATIAIAANRADMAEAVRDQLSSLN